jgi:hypothetical protein
MYRYPANDNRTTTCNWLLSDAAIAAEAKIRYELAYHITAPELVLIDGETRVLCAVMLGDRIVMGDCEPEDAELACRDLNENREVKR